MRASLLLLSIAVAVGLSHGRYHSDRRSYGGPLPSYLRYVDDDARAEYASILSDDEKTIASQKKEIIDWAEKHDVMEDFDKFYADMSRTMEEFDQNVMGLIEDLPSAYERYSEIMDNEDQTLAERKEALEDMRSENPELFRVLKFTIDQFKPWQGSRESGKERSGRGHRGRHSSHEDGSRSRRHNDIHRREERDLQRAKLNNDN